MRLRQPPRMSWVSANRAITCRLPLSERCLEAVEERFGRCFGQGLEHIGEHVPALLIGTVKQSLNRGGGHRLSRATTSHLFWTNKRPQDG